MHPVRSPSEHFPDPFATSQRFAVHQELSVMGEQVETCLDVVGVEGECVRSKKILDRIPISYQINHRDCFLSIRSWSVRPLPRPGEPACRTAVVFIDSR